MQGKSHRAGQFQCNACRTSFSVTLGTVMEDSHLPLHKWALAFRLMASSKKGVSAHQLHRTLGITYKTAWFLGHRLREAMRDYAPVPLGGEGKIVEADEMYHGTKEIKTPSPKRTTPYTKGGKSGGAKKRVVVALVERGGEVRAVAITCKRVTAANVRQVLVTHADRASACHTGREQPTPSGGRGIRQARDRRSFPGRICSRQGRQSGDD